MVITNRDAEQESMEQDTGKGFVAQAQGFNKVKFTSEQLVPVKSKSSHYDHCRIEIYHQYHCVIAKDDEGCDRLVDYFHSMEDAHDRAIDYDIRYKFNGN